LILAVPGLDLVDAKSTVEVDESETVEKAAEGIVLTRPVGLHEVCPAEAEEPANERAIRSGPFTSVERWCGYHEAQKY